MRNKLKIFSVILGLLILQGCSYYSPEAIEAREKAKQERLAKIEAEEKLKAEEEQLIKDFCVSENDYKCSFFGGFAQRSGYLGNGTYSGVIEVLDSEGEWDYYLKAVVKLYNGERIEKTFPDFHPDPNNVRVPKAGEAIYIYAGEEEMVNAFGVVTDVLNSYVLYPRAKIVELARAGETIDSVMSSRKNN